MAEEKKSGLPSFDRKKSARIKTRASARIRSSKEPRQARPVAAGDVPSFRVICSECYEEFDLNPEKEVETFNCPDCDHPAKGPQKDFLGKLAMLKMKEKKNFLVSVASMIIAIVAFFLWQIVTINPEAQNSFGYAFLGLFIIGALVSLVSGIMYESKRYEVYF